MSHDFLADRKKALVDEFFHKEEEKKLERYRAKLEQQKTRDELRDASCVIDDGVLDSLMELGLTADTVSAIALAPLVHVAWADGTVRPKEREAIERAAGEKGITTGSHAAELLTGWLSGSEPPNLYQVWADYIKALSAQLDSGQKSALKQQVLGFARAVAEAAGGVLGIGSVSKSEEAALSDLEAAFED